MILFLSCKSPYVLSITVYDCRGLWKQHNKGYTPNNPTVSKLIGHAVLKILFGWVMEWLGEWMLEWIWGWLLINLMKWPSSPWAKGVDCLIRASWNLCFFHALIIYCRSNIPFVNRYMIFYPWCVHPFPLWAVLLTPKSVSPTELSWTVHSVMTVRFCPEHQVLHQGGSVVPALCPQALKVSRNNMLIQSFCTWNFFKEYKSKSRD